MAIRRGFGIKDDVAVGGSSFDDLTAGTDPDLKNIPDADIWWPATGGTFDPNLQTINRDAEVRGRRAQSAPLPFREDPVMTVPLPAYRKIVEKLAKKTLGGADTRTGTPPAAIVHTIATLGFGATALPAIYVQMIRDDLNLKMSGGAVNRWTLNFPMDGEGTMEAEIWGLYHQFMDPADAFPTPTFTGYDDILMLRDAKAFFDPTAVPDPPNAITGTSIADLQGIELTWVNNLTRKPYAGRNVASRVLGTPPLTRKVWYPEENRLGAAQDVTFALQFGSVNTAQEIARDFQQIQKIAVSLIGAPLGTTPPANEEVRVTIFNGAWTGGGADALSARDETTTRLEGGAFYSTADAADIKFQVLNGDNTDIT